MGARLSAEQGVPEMPSPLFLATELACLGDQRQVMKTVERCFKVPRGKRGEQTRAEKLVYDAIDDVCRKTQENLEMQEQCLQWLRENTLAYLVQSQRLYDDGIFLEEHL